MPSERTYRVPYDDARNDHSLALIRARLAAAATAVRGRVLLHPASRVAQWERLLAELAGANRSDVVSQLVSSLQRGSWNHPYRPHFRALVESRSFIEIVEQLIPDLRASDLKDLVSGTLDPAIDRADSRARDREFELFVAAVCRRSGLEVQLAEPDVLYSSPHGTRSIAAKRLSSRRTVRANVSKAAQQIAASGHPGIICLDVTRLIEPHYEYVMHWAREKEFLPGKLLTFERSEFRDVFARNWNEHVRGIVLRVVFPLLSEGLRLGTYENWYAVGVPEDGGRELNEFLSGFLRGLNGV
jgi:hypothetical protein